jgi:hypothetical protein
MRGREAFRGHGGRGPWSDGSRLMDVIAYRPDPSEFAWTFGGVPPVRTVKPRDILELWTEDAFGGKIRAPTT